MNFTEKLIKDYERMVYKVAWKYTQDQELIKDLIQEGYIGLRKACKKYNKNKKTEFSTYAHIKIEGQIRQYVHYKINLVHIPISHNKVCFTEEINEEKHEYDTKPIDLSIDLNHALDLIDKKTADIIRMHYIDGITKIDITKITGINRNKVREIINGGLVSLGDILKDGGYQ